MAEGKNNKLNIKPFYNFSFNEMMKNYIKEFNTFEEGYTEMISILPSIKIYGGEVANYDIVVKKMMELIGENIPSPTNPNYPNTLAFTIKQNEVSFKTDDRIAFGWRILFDKESGNYKYQMRITFFAVSMSTRKYADALEENGWVIALINKDKFRKQSSKNNSNNNKKSNKQEKAAQEEASSKNISNKKNDAKSNKPKQKVVAQQVQENVAVQEQVQIIEQQQPVQQVVQDQVQQQEAPAPKKPEPKKYWITRGAVAGVFIITYEGRQFVVNINDAAQPAGVLVDRNSSSIRIGQIVYNYESLNYVIDEGTSQFEEKESEGEDEYIIPQGATNAQQMINTPSISQMVSPSGNSIAQTVVRMTDA